MPIHFTLAISLLPDRVTLRLRDQHARHLAAYEFDPTALSLAQQAALFDTRHHIETLESTTPAQTQLTALSHLLTTHLLGPQITAALTDATDARTLLLLLPDPTTSPLAASLARVPWDLARSPKTNQTFLDLNVSLRITLEGTEPIRQTALPIAPGEPIRVLLVFAETPGSRPLAARLERQSLRDLFFQHILPTHRVEVDILAHGVTRARLEEQIRKRGGYHLVHWSGHGHQSALELTADDGQHPILITGNDLARLFQNAGGFLPQIIFLSACHSGSLPSAPRPGTTGAALALLAAGVNQIIAMRYEVGDTYARRLARRFYRGLLAEPAHHSADKALSLARRELSDDTARAADYHPVDHLTPLVFGSSPVTLYPTARRSAHMDRRAPKQHLLLPSGSRALDKPLAFVGREDLLAQLARTWLAPTRRGTRTAPIALLLGPEGIGKTTLAAEALHTWFDRFDHLIAFQAGGKALSLEDLLQKLDHLLRGESPTYRQRCDDNDRDAVYLPPKPALTGPARQEAMHNNLLETLRAESILLVLDGFDASLLSIAGPEGYAAQDTAWDTLLGALAERLGETASRLLLTSRCAPSALASPEHTLTLALGLLPLLDIAAFFDADPFLRALRPDGSHPALGDRLRAASLGHPARLARIAELARKGRSQPGPLSPAAKVALEDELARLEAPSSPQ